MPLTDAEKRKRYVEKIKINGSYEDFKKKKAEQEKERRQRKKNELKKLSESKRNQKIAENRLKNRKRMEEYRKRKKQSELAIKNGYRTTGALKKAYTKMRNAMPSAPLKREALVEKLLNSFDKTTREKIARNSVAKEKRVGHGISSDVVDAVIKFYENDEISRISPNVKDCRKYFDPAAGKKVLKQMRHLMFTLKEAYSMFIDDYSIRNPAVADVPIKLSKFCDLRPDHVKLVASTPHNVCGCIYHTNLIESCTVLNKHLDGFPKYGPDLMNLLLCKETDQNCWFKTCKRCSPNATEKIIMALSNNNPSKRIKWILWEKNKEANRFEQSCKEGTVNDLLDYFKSIYVAFLKHSFIKRGQAAFFKLDIETIDDETCVLQIDFAENFTCEAQQEIQSTHWNQKQISLFTAAVHYKSKMHPKVIVSDNTDHSKNTFIPYLYDILSKMPKKIKTVKIWSDGPSSQFKNKFVASAIPFFEKLFGIKIIWNFFPTAHGKGCIDGLGAVVKRTVRTKVISRRSIVTCAKQFVDAFNDGQSSIEVYETTSSDIESIRAKLKLDEIFVAAPAVKDIRSCHQLQFINNKTVGFIAS